MNNKKVLLLGANGFLGSKLLELAPGNIKLRASCREKSLNNKQVAINLFDFVDLRKKINKIKPQIIIHAARVHPFDSDPVEAKKAMEELVTVIKLLKSKLVYVSSDSVFDGKKGNYKESDKANPVNDYGKAKLAAETVIKNNLNDFIIVRPSYIYDDCLNELDKREFQLFNQIKNGETVYRFRDAFRSPILVKDLASTIWKLIEKDYVGIIHVGGKRKSIYDFYKELAEKLKLDSNLIKPNSIFDVSQKIAPDTSLNTELVKKILKDIQKF
jgi:dTDP-4-dehydrorhamnose reductase